MFGDLVVQLEEAVFGVVSKDSEKLARSSKRLSFMFTSERVELSNKYFSDADSLDAYIAAFLLPNAVKVIHCLWQMHEMDQVPSGDVLSVLDVGCGPATASLAASLFFSSEYPEKRVRLAGIEQNKAALLKAHQLFKKIAPPHHSFETAMFPIKDGSLEPILKAQRFDVIIAANVLNELASSAHQLCSELISNRLKEHGALIIIEPALRNSARALMVLRDRLVAERVACVFAPCLHDQNCPMLKANERDWCHFYIDWDCPKRLSKLDRISGMNHDYLKMAYLILKPKMHSPDDAQKIDLWRAVSSPLDSKGKREIFLCGANGKLKRARRTSKDASDVNNGLETAARGDIIRYAGGDRILKEDSFSIVNEWIG